MNKDVNKNKNTISFIGIAVLIASVLAILFSGSSVISRDKIDKRLQQFADSIARAAAANGKEGKLTHGDVSIDGWGYDKHAIVSNVTLELDDKAANPPQSWTLSTDKMLINPDRALANQLFFLFPDPLSVASNGQAQLTVSFSSPLKYSYFDGREHNTRVISHNILLPEQMVVTPVKQPNEQDAAGKVVFAYGANPVLHIKELPDNHEREAVYTFNHVKISGDDGASLTIASLNSNFDEKPVPAAAGSGEHGTQGTYKLALSDAVLTVPNKTGKPYSVDVDISYVTDQGTPGAGNSPAGVVPNFGSNQVQLHKLMLAGDAFKLQGDGTINTANDDQLPYGTMTLTIDNASAFLASDLIPEQLRGTAAAVLQKIAGKPVTAQEQTSIALKRDKNGQLYIGNTTLEELTASLLSDMIKQGTTAPTVAAPAAPTAQPPATPVKPDATAVPSVTTPDATSTTSAQPPLHQAMPVQGSQQLASPTPAAPATTGDQATPAVPDAGK